MRGFIITVIIAVTATMLLYWFIIKPVQTIVENRTQVLESILKNHK